MATSKAPMLKAAIARDFRGGLNTVDSELNLTSKYFVAGTNLAPDSNGKLSLRYGTSPFTEVPAVGNGIAIEYFAGSLIVVGENGIVVQVAADGTVTTIFDTTIAAALPGAPAGWSTGLTYACFTQYVGQLIITNGVDKPLSVDEAFNVTYLQDPATGSNANVPRAKYCTTFNSHLILAVTPDDSYTIFVSGTDTTTFVGDPGTNAANHDLSAHVDRGVPIITGLSPYRDRCLVAFQEAIVAVSIVVPDTGDIIIDVTDVLSDYGAIAHKAIVSLGDDTILTDAVGMSAVRRSTISTDMLPSRINSLLAPAVQKSLIKLSNTQLADYVFAIHDRIAKQVLFFIPKSDTITATTENDVWVYCYAKEQKWSAWTHFDQMPYRAACRTTEGRIFFVTGTDIRYYRNAYEPLYTDVSSYGEQNWDDGDAWDDGVGWLDTASVVTASIAFTLRLPYTDFKTMFHSKTSNFIGLLTEGRATFTVDMYTDKFTDVALSMQFTASNTPVPSSSAARTNDDLRLYSWPAKFVRMQLELTGVASSEFNIIAIGLLYQQGTVGR